MRSAHVGGEGLKGVARVDTKMLAAPGKDKGDGVYQPHHTHTPPGRLRHQIDYHTQSANTPGRKLSYVTGDYRHSAVFFFLQTSRAFPLSYLLFPWLSAAFLGTGTGLERDKTASSRGHVRGTKQKGR